MIAVHSYLLQGMGNKTYFLNLEGMEPVVFAEFSIRGTWRKFSKF